MNKLRVLGAVFFGICAIEYGSVEAQNKALQLIGEADTYFEVQDHDSLDIDLENSFTVEAWVNPEISFGENMVVNKEDVYEIAVKDTTFQTAVKPTGPFGPAGWAWLNSEEEVLEEEWTHIAMTWDGEFVNTFVNGDFITSFEVIGDEANDSPDTLKVGRRVRGDATHSAYLGLIDEVRISNIVRYTEDGYTLPTAAFKPDENTVALYHFDEEDNGVVKDASNLGNDGMLVGDATLVVDDFLESVPSLPGDFDNDGTLGMADIKQLLEKIALGPQDISCDLNGDSLINRDDLIVWVKDLKNTWIGDSNLDGEFNSSDFVAVFQSGKFEQDVDASWAEGDWTGDLRFSSADFVAAFQDGGFEMGPRGAASSVPEPSCAILLSIGILGLRRFRRSR